MNSGTTGTGRNPKKSTTKKAVGRPKLPPDLVKVKKSIALLPATYEFLQRHGLEDGKPNVSLGVENVVAELKKSAKTIRELRRELKQKH
jgi:hypothetical protein